MKTNILTLVVTLTVGIILAGSLLMPVVTDAQSTVTATTMYNTDLTSYGEGKYYTEDTTLLWDIEGTDISESKFYVNGVETTAYIPGAGIVPIAVGDEFMVLMHDYSTSNNVTAIYVYKDETGYHNTQAFVSGGDVTITYSKTAGTITLTIGSNEIATVESSHFFGKAVAGQGDYILITAGSFTNVVISQEAIDSNTGGVIAVWLSNITVGDTTYQCRAISDVNGTFGVATAAGVTNEIDVDLTFSGLTPIDNSVDLFNHGTPQLSWTFDDEVKTLPVTSSFVLKEVNGHVENGASSLIGVIPIMVIVAILMTAIGTIALRRAD